MPRVNNASPRFVLLTALLAQPLAGCPAEEEGNDDAIADTDAASTSDGSGTETAADETAGESTGADPGAAFECDEELVVGLPLFGPGIDPETGAFTGTADSYIVSTTQLIVRDDDEARARFDELVGAMIPELMMSEGLIGMSFAGEDGCSSQRTLSIWADTESMIRFVSTTAHTTAMAETGMIGEDARAIHWEQPAADGPPTWEQALAEIDSVGSAGY